MTPTLKLAATTERVRVASARELLALPGVEAGGADDERGAALDGQRGVRARAASGTPVKSSDDVLGAQDGRQVVADRHAERRAARDHAGVLARSAGCPGASTAPATRSAGVLARRG